MKIENFKMKNAKGFSLVELLVVITIIAILSVVAYTAIGGQTIKAKNSRRLQDLNTLQQALELYFVKTNEYPVNLTDMGTDIINKIPTDPNDTDPYYYRRGDKAPMPTGQNKRSYILATVQDAVEATDVLKSYVTTNDDDFELDGWKKTDGTGNCGDTIDETNAHESTVCVPYLP